MSSFWLSFLSNAWRDWLGLCLPRLRNFELSVTCLDFCLPSYYCTCTVCLVARWAFKLNFLAFSTVSVHAICAHDSMFCFVLFFLQGILLIYFLGILWCLMLFAPDRTPPQITEFICVGDFVYYCWLLQKQNHMTTFQMYSRVWCDARCFSFRIPPPLVIPTPTRPSRKHAHSF